MKRGVAEVLLALLLVAASIDDAMASQAPGPAKRGAVAGFVKLAGASPPARRIPVSKNKEVCGKDVEDESLVVGPQNGLRYAVVTIEGVKGGRPVELGAGTRLDNQKCRFVPHVQAVSVGQFLYLVNTDPVLHTYYALLDSKRVLFNVALWPGRELRKPMVYPGVVRITCGVHPWMTAYVVVTEGPYQAVTDAYGEYEIGDLPPGHYNIRVWHELLGSKEKQVEIRAGEKTQLNFTLSTPGEKR